MDEPVRIELKVMRSIWAALRPKMVSSWRTISSTLPRTWETEAVRVKEKPTLMLFWHFHPFLV
jgi:hypothetical protein